MSLKPESERYWIESVTESPEGDIQRITLSCREHGACIEILGGCHEATERMLKILVALNEDDAND